MDSVTQATLGAAIGHLCWNKKIGNKALLIGAFGGTIPDLDIILYPVLDDVQRLYWHRGESHSVWFVILGSMLTGWLLTQYFKRERLSFGSASLGAVLIYATHILIDYFTVYGTQLLAPLSRNGFALGNFFIIDPLFTLPLLVGCVVAALSKTPLGRRVNVAGLALATCYMFWSFDLQNPYENSMHSVLPQLDAPMQTLTLLTGRIFGGKDWYLTSTGISMGAGVTMEDALHHSTKVQPL